MGGVVGSTTGSDDYTEDDKTSDGEDLDTGEPELGLSVDTSTHEVDGENDNETDGDPDTVVDGLVPVVDQDGGGRQFSG